MKRSPILRRQELRSKRRKSDVPDWLFDTGTKPHTDPVLENVRNYVIARDQYRCVGVTVGMKGECEGHGEIDHVDNAGKSRRGPSIPSNLVCLCSKHHLMKTSHASQWRPQLRDYLRRVEGGAWGDERWEFPA